MPPHSRHALSSVYRGSIYVPTFKRLSSLLKRREVGPKISKKNYVTLTAPNLEAIYRCWLKLAKINLYTKFEEASLASFVPETEGVPKLE